MSFTIFFLCVIALRLSELIISKRNEKWLRAQGAIEYGRGHYPFMILLHVVFFVSMYIENFVTSTEQFDPTFLIIYVLLVIAKIWIIVTLGKYWCTRILRVPNFPGIRKGPYKIFHHPNYVIVVAEIVILPLVFHLYYTAVIFSLLNAIMLFIRIREENKAWGY